jgi:probable O-glycosylation ligase (exosortase A-associated)
MRDLAIFLVFFALLPVCLARPFVGLLAYAVFAYLNPHRLTWGAAYDFSFAQTLAIVTIIGLGISFLRDRKSVRMPWEREVWLLLALWCMYFFTTFFALRPDWAWPALQFVSKILLMAFVAMMLVTDMERIRLYVLIVICSIGFYGVKGGVFAIQSGGNFMVFGPPGTFIEGNTALGVALNMVLPMMFFQARIEKDRRVKFALRAAFGLTVLAVLFTYSRGAFLGLVAVGFALFCYLSTRLKLAVVAFALVATPVVLSMLPEKFIERVETIKTYEQDGSANARLVAWATAWEIAKDRPLIGGGFGIIDDAAIGHSYNPEFNPTTVGAHSAYFEVMGENGLLAFAIFMALMISALLSTRRIQKQGRQREHSPAPHYASMLQVGILGYAVSAAFLEFAAFDLYYNLIVLVIALKSALRRERQAEEAAAAPLGNRWPLAAGTAAMAGQGALGGTSERLRRNGHPG